MLIFLYAIIPVLAWGTWLAPSQNIRFPSQQVKTLYVAMANILLSSLVFAIQGPLAWKQLNINNFSLVFAGGLIWSLSGLCAFTATAKIGQARAFGIWAPLNIITSMLWGAFLFNEFLQIGPSTMLLLAGSLVVIIAGVLMIIFAKGMETGDKQGRQDFYIGLLGASGAGVLWGSYFIPIRYSGISMWVGTFPMALGILAGSLLLTWLARSPIRLQETGATGRAFATGVIWTIGNFGMLLLVGALGAGRGFTIAQLSVVVNALVGIFILKDPTPRSRAATLTLLGCVLAMLGGIILGNLK
jgi:glucose uptake protein